MPRFYFDVHQGANFIPDQIGSELDSLDAAEREAAQTAVELGRDWMPHARVVCVEVRDEQFRPVLALTLALTIERRLAPLPHWM
jgi:hypothetical protein